MTSITVDIPFPDGRFSFESTKDFLKLLLEAIENFRLSSNTPREKRLMIPSKLLATYVAYGTMKLNSFFEKDNRKLGLLRGRINRKLIDNGAIKSGNCIVIEPEVIKKIEKGIKWLKPE